MPASKLLGNSALVLLCIWLGLVVYWYLNGVSGLLTIRDYVFEPWPIIRYWTLFIWAPWLPLAPLMLYLAGKLKVTPGNWGRAVLAHVGLLFLLSLAHGFLGALLYYHVGWMSEDMATYEPWQHAGHFLFDDNLFLFDAFIYATVAAVINIRHFYDELRRKEVDAARMQGQLAESRLQALKMQVSPHFLFNTLNSISVLIRLGQAAKANEMVSRLSDFFRRTLQDGPEELVPLEREIALVRGYLDIEQVRFGDRLAVEYAIDEDCLAVPVPALLLQPLVENALKHGLAGKQGRCMLRLTAGFEGEALRLVLVDNGAGLVREATRPGIGLSNVQARLRQHYGEDCAFTLESGPGGGVRVELRLPAARPVAQVA